MSDLAPFIAATLRDRVMSDLLEENQRLREKERKHESVEVTGPNRTPVYARGHLRDDGQFVHRGWVVNLESVVPCPLKKLNHLEVWARNCMVKRYSPVMIDGECDNGDWGLSLSENVLEVLIDDPFCKSNEYAEKGPLANIRMTLGWTLHDLKRHVDQPLIREIIDLCADENGVPLPNCDCTGDWLFDITKDLSQIDPTKECTFERVVLRPEYVHGLPALAYQLKF